MWISRKKYDSLMDTIEELGVNIVCANAKNRELEEKHEKDVVKLTEAISKTNEELVVACRRVIELMDQS